MNVTVRLLSHIGFAVASLVVAQNPAPNAEGWISLRILPSAQPKTLNYLATVAEPVPRTLPKPIPAKQLILDTYGYYSDQLFILLKQYNPSLKKLDDEMSGNVLLPVSPKFEFNKHFVISQPNYLVSNLAATKMGSYGTNARTQIAKLNPGIDLNKQLHVGQEIVLPYSADPVTFKLKAQFSPNVRQVLATLDRAQGVFYTEQVSGFSVVPYWPSTLSAADPACDVPLSPDWWFKDVLGKVGDLSGMTGTSVIAIADSGITRDDDRFAPVLWTNYKELRGGDDEDNDHNNCYHDVIGCSFITHGYPEDDLDIDDEFRHGTHVAGIASGRTLQDPLKAALARSVRLMILKIANSDGLIEPGRIHEAIAYVQDKQAKVVNMSFEGDDTGTITRNLIKSNPQILFVVAAGNDKSDLDDEKNATYPAVLGSELSNVITVAASNQEKKIACFSNWGAKTVMIAAPGTYIYSTVDVGEQFHSGTSQATPLVSLAAAMLDAKGIHDPSDIRRRIFSTVTFVPGLPVMSEGILNIEKALAFESDVVQKKSGEVITGEIQPRDLTVNVNGADTSLSSLESIVIDHLPKDSKPDRIWRLHSNKLEFVDTDLGSLTITIRLKDGTSIPISRDDISSIVPAWNLHP